MPQWLSSSLLTSTSTASSAGQTSSARAPARGRARRRRLCAESVETTSVRWPSSRRADGGGRREAGLADAALARVEDDPRLHAVDRLPPRAPPRGRAGSTSSAKASEPAQVVDVLLQLGHQHRPLAACRPRAARSPAARRAPAPAARAASSASFAGERRGDAARAVRAAWRAPAGGIEVHAVHDEGRRSRISFSTQPPVEVERLLEGRAAAARPPARSRCSARAAAPARSAARAVKPSYMPSKARKNSESSCRNCRPRKRSASFSERGARAGRDLQGSRPALK